MGYRKKKKKAVKIGDPNAKALWTRTRAQIFKAKKGRGSFKRDKKISDEDLG